MSVISIQATDTLFFRDGRPFSMGEETFAKGIFPPHPSVLHGAIRSVFISDKMNEGKELKNGISDLIELSKNFSIELVALKQQSLGKEDEEFWFPMPKDLVVYKSDESKASALKLLPSPKYSSLSNFKKIPTSTKDEKTIDGLHLISLASFEYYLNGVSDIGVKHINKLIKKETKIGIGRNADSHTTEEGRLFRVLMNRPAVSDNNNIEKLSFVVKVNNLDIKSEGWLALGAERKVASFKKEDDIDIPCPQIDSTEFKIYLSTPAVFENGWIPENLLKNYDLELVSAAIGRSIDIGGWDLENTQPKPMVSMVDAGAVFFVKAKNIDAAKKAATEIHGQSITDNPNDIKYSQQGFGIAFVGKINANL